MEATDLILSEYDASTSWNEEYTTDRDWLVNLENSVRPSREVLAGSQQAAPSALSEETIRRIILLDEARASPHMVKPKETSPRQQEVKQRQTLTFMGLSIDDFVKLDTTLSNNGVNYYYWAMPQNPTQGQYKAVDRLSNCHGVVVAETHEHLLTDDLSKNLRQSGYMKLSAEARMPLWDAIAVSGQGRNESKGTFNTGKVVMGCYRTDMHRKGFFKTFENVVDNNCDFVYENMAQRTGLWYRENKTLITLEKGHENWYKEDILQNRIEAYYTLIAALQSVGMPVYALRTEKGERLSSISERAWGDLTSKIVVDDSVHPHIGTFIGRRFSACMLQLAEVGYCLTDAKPANFLFQRAYSQIKLTNGEMIDFPACVVATDIDPQFSVLVDIATPSTDGNQRRRRPTKEESGYMAVSECIRFANHCVFSIQAGCWSENNKLYLLEIMKAVLTPMKRYAGISLKRGGAFFCGHFFDPKFADGKLSGEQRHNSKCWYDERPIQSEAGNLQASMQESTKWTEDKWNTFWKNLAKQFASTTNHYGLKAMRNNNEDNGKNNTVDACSSQLFRSLHNIEYQDFINKLLGRDPKTDVNLPGAQSSFGVLVVMLVEWYVNMSSYSP
jgi:hypothetical protein